MINCPECAAQLVGNESFCHRCGHPVPPIAAAAATPQQSAATPVNQIDFQQSVEYLPPQSAAMARGSGSAFAIPQSGGLQVKQAQAAAGLAQMFGLDPRVALLAVVLDNMLFVGELATWGVLVVFSVVAGAVFGVITYKAQKSWYGDDHDSALLKGLIMGLITAIPTSIPGFLYIPAGFLGLVNLIRKKNKS